MTEKIRRTAILGLSAVLLAAAPAQTQAAAETVQTTESAAAETVQTTESAAAESVQTTDGTAAELSITSETAVLMDADTGEVLYDKGMDERRYPASITKLMTLLVAVENSSPEDTVTFTETGVRDVTWDSGNIGMQLGEVMTMEDCWYAAIIQSANEVCAQIAETVGGTEAAFIDMMNQKAQELGCTNTHFANASGLPDENQYTTARDMAKIMQAGLQNETFRRVVGSTDYTIPATNMSAARSLHTHVPLLAKENGFYYEGCIAGKTGYTQEAGHTLAVAAERDGHTYIAVTMKTSDLGINCTDARTLFDYAFSHVQEAAPTPTPTVMPSPTPTVTPSSTPAPTDTAETSDITESTQDSTEQSGDEKASEPAESKEEQNGLSTAAKFLLGVMAAMAVVLAGLLIALYKKRKYR